MLSPTALLEALGAALPTTRRGQVVLQDRSEQLLSLVTGPCQQAGWDLSFHWSSKSSRGRGASFPVMHCKTALLC